MIGLVGFFCSALSVGIFVLLSRQYVELVDRRDGLQNINDTFVSRLGGFGMILGLTALVVISQREMGMRFLLILSPVILVGAFEDFAGGVRASLRLLSLLISAVLAVVYFDNYFRSFGLYFLDNSIFQYPYAVLIISVLILAGFANGFNIIDGFNGLMLGHALSISVVLYLIGSHLELLNFSNTLLLLIGCILGLFIFNYPFGLIFSGDLGAYFLGFSLSFLTLYLINLDPLEVSPILLFVLIFYPGFEVFFSFIRKPLEGRSPMRPDGYHLHFLVLKLLSNRLTFTDRITYNILVSFILYVIFLPGYIVSLWFFDDRIVLLTTLFCQISFYILLYFLLRLVALR